VAGCSKEEPPAVTATPGAVDTKVAPDKGANNGGAAPADAPMLAPPGVKTGTP